MKHSNMVKRYQLRLKAYESIDAKNKSGFNRPGSIKKN